MSRHGCRFSRSLGLLTEKPTRQHANNSAHCIRHKYLSSGSRLAQSVGNRNVYTALMEPTKISQNSERAFHIIDANNATIIINISTSSARLPHRIARAVRGCREKGGAPRRAADLPESRMHTMPIHHAHISMSTDAGC